MTPDCRALCAELLRSLENYPVRPPRDRDLCVRARALLAEPPAEGPSASDVTELFYRHMGEGSEVGFENAIAEALSRWGRPAAAPVPVSERLPGLDVKCWWFDSTKQWYFRSWKEINIAGLKQPTHWLPFDALLLPQVAELEAQS